MKYIVECEYLKDYTSDTILCESLEEANKEAVFFGTAFKRNPLRNTLELCETASVSYITEECLNDSAYGEDGSIDWHDYDPNCTYLARYGFFGRSLANLVNDVYPGLCVLDCKDAMLDDLTHASLKSLCKEAHEFGRGNPRIDFLNGNAESCIDAFNEACRCLNICLRNADGSSELLRIDYNF